MTAEEKQRQLAKMIAEEVVRNQPEVKCPHGIDANTARAVLDFAKMWDGGKLYTIRAIIIVIVGGMATALWCGIRMMITQK